MSVGADAVADRAGAKTGTSSSVRGLSKLDIGASLADGFAFVCADCAEEEFDSVFLRARQTTSAMGRASMVAIDPSSPQPRGRCRRQSPTKSAQSPEFGDGPCRLQPTVARFIPDERRRPQGEAASTRSRRAASPRSPCPARSSHGSGPASAGACSGGRRAPVPPRRCSPAVSGTPRVSGGVACDACGRTRRASGEPRRVGRAPFRHARLAEGTCRRPDRRSG